MSRRLAAVAAAALLAAATAFAQAPSKPAPATATEPPGIKLRLDEADLRKLGPATSTGTPAGAPAAEGSLPTLGGNPASQETRTRLFDRGAGAGSGRGPFPKDENPNIR